MYDTAAMCLHSTLVPGLVNNAAALVERHHGQPPLQCHKVLGVLAPHSIPDNGNVNVNCPCSVHTRCINVYDANTMNAFNTCI